MKKFRLLLAAMLAFVFNSGVWAQTTFTYGANTYEISSGTREVTLVEIGQGTANADIPETVTYNSVPYTVTAITGNVVERCKGDLKTVKLPNTLKSFYGLDSNNRFISPFTGCTILTTVNMSNCTALTWLERNAFLDLTSLTTVQLPTTITHIVDGAFSGCTNLKNINLSKLKQIDEFAFDGCEKLDNISLSSATIGENAFCDCKGLKSLSLTGCTLGQYAFSGCTILQNLTMSGIVFISKGCFQDCVNLQSISLPASLCYMDENAFNGTELKHIYCTGSGVVNAHPRFYPDASDVTVHVPCGYASLYKKMSVWNNAAFTFKESGNLTLNVSAGESNGQVSVQAGSQTWTIPAAGGELTQTVEVPQNVKVTVPQQYFNKILVNGADMTSSLTSTVSGNNKTFTLTEFTETINIQVLFNTIPYDQLTFFFSGDNSVTTTFEYGSTSTSVAPGTSQKTITGLTGISEVRAYFKTVNKPTVYHGSTNWSDRLEYLSSEGKYKLAINTSELTTDVFTVVFPIPADAGTYITFADNTVKQLCIAHWDTNGDGKLSEAEAAQVTSLLDSDNNSVFQGNQNITSFDEFKYFTGLTTIPSSAFSECKQLQSITLPASIRKIENLAFYDCNSLKGITLPEGLTEIGEWVFCKTQMETFYLPKNVTSIGRCILSMNDNLISIVVSPENQKFDSRNGCNAIIRKNVGSTPSLVIGCRYTMIPEDVVNISYGAFDGVTGMTSIVLPASVDYVADYAFANCTNLTSIVSKTTRPNYLTEGESNFMKISPNCVLTVPAGSRQTYIDRGWTTDIFKGGIVEAEGDKLTALLVPSNGGMMSLTTSTGAFIYGPNAEAGVLNLNIGGNYVLLVDNPKSYCYDLTLYVNGVDRTSELVLDDGWYKLNLDNVTEDIHAKAVYTKKLSDFAVISSIGGTTQIEYTTTSGVTRTVDLSSSSNDRFYRTEKQLGTDVTLTLTPDKGYEIGLVYTNTDLAFSNDEGGIQDIGDGKYKVVMPPLMVDNSIGENMVVIFKKTGTNPNYDVNGDGSVTITDAVLIVNEILGQ